MAKSEATYSQDFLRSNLGGPFGVLGKLSELRELIPENQKEFLQVIDAFKAVVLKAIVNPDLKLDLRSLVNIINFVEDNKDSLLQAIASWQVTDEREKEKKLKATEALNALFGSIENLGKFMDNSRKLEASQCKELNIHNRFRNVAKNLTIEESPEGISIKAHGVEVTMRGNRINVPGKFSSLSLENKIEIANAAALMAAKKGWENVTIHIDYQKNPSDAVLFTQALVENGFSLNNIYVQNGAEPRVKVRDALSKSGKRLLSVKQTQIFEEMEQTANMKLKGQLALEQVKNITDGPQPESYKCKSSYMNMLKKLIGQGNINQLEAQLGNAIRNLETTNTARAAQQSQAAAESDNVQRGVSQMLSPDVTATTAPTCGL